MRLVCWNVYVGNSRTRVLREVMDIISKYRPEIIILTEAKNIYPITNKWPGYRRIHYKPTKSRFDENGNICILVRNDVRILKFLKWRMKRRWWFRKNRRRPRVYIFLGIIADGVPWRIVGAHWPFGWAKKESQNAAMNWLKASGKTRSIYVGDLNTRPKQINKALRGTGAKRIGPGIDQALYKNISKATVASLGNRGSDHPALLYTFWK